MTENEKMLLRLYFVNQGFRYDMRLKEVETYFFSHKNCTSCLQYEDALKEKECFDKFQHDICTLLNL